MNDVPSSRLQHLQGSYLNQDFVLDYGDWKNAVATFIKESDYDFILGAREEISELLASSADDKEIARTVTFDTTGFDPRRDGFTTYREWLVEVAKMLDQAISKEP